MTVTTIPVVEDGSAVRLPRQRWKLVRSANDEERAPTPFASPTR